MHVLKEKMVLMGLARAGKTTIARLIFEKKIIGQIIDYNATIGFERDTAVFLDEDIQIIDCGGQDIYIKELLTEQAAFIFSNVRSLIWVVDSATADLVSKSRFHFNTAVQELNRYSPEAKIFVLFHKSDILKKERRKIVFENLKAYFETSVDNPRSYFQTSIFDYSIYTAFGDILQHYIASSNTLSELRSFVTTLMNERNENFLHLAIYTLDGIPVVEAGVKFNKHQQKLLRDWSKTVIDFKSQREPTEVAECIIKTDNDKYIVFRSIKGILLLSIFIQKIKSLDNLEKTIKGITAKLDVIL